MRKLKRNLSALLCLISLGISAQQYKFSAPVNAVSHDDYYSIDLKEEITAVVQNDFSDLRLMDENGVECPYLLRDAKGSDIWEKLISPQIIKKDSAKCTYIQLVFPSARLIQRLSIQVENPELYHRAAQLFVKRSYQDKKRKVVNYEEVLHSFVLATDQANDIILPAAIKEKEIILRIENNDDQPLRIEKILLFYRKISLVAKLEKDKQYTLYFGNNSVSKPNYDIVYFNEKIPEQLQEIQYGKSSLTKDKTPTDIRSQSIIENKVFLWIMLFVVGITLLFFSVRMIRDMKKEK